MTWFNVAGDVVHLRLHLQHLILRPGKEKFFMSLFAFKAGVPNIWPKAQHQSIKEASSPFGLMPS